MKQEHIALLGVSHHVCMGQCRKLKNASECVDVRMYTGASSCAIIAIAHFATVPHVIALPDGAWRQSWLVPWGVLAAVMDLCSILLLLQQHCLVGLLWLQDLGYLGKSRILLLKEALQLLDAQKSCLKLCLCISIRLHDVRHLRSQTDCEGCSEHC